ncbi:hypothetical protein Pint_30395 [Pistacia integerrima]|uniref:Uncharacterized protein n=1 Tax=Pistacia integerrima TaxID=434235 RepID=A0ACC0WXT0_9ROSI|nr:hypothetical protein Pint_30395 [Pistacia integerrima]
MLIHPLDDTPEIIIPDVIMELKIIKRSIPSGRGAIWGQHRCNIGVPAVGIAFPGYVAQPQLSLGKFRNNMVISFAFIGLRVGLPVLAGAAGALGTTCCPPYIAVDGGYHPCLLGQTSRTSSSRLVVFYLPVR